MQAASIRGAPKLRLARDIDIPDLHIDTLTLKAWNFR
jgi:hypothetical protein